VVCYTITRDVSISFVIFSDYSLIARAQWNDEWQDFQCFILFLVESWWFKI